MSNQPALRPELAVGEALRGIGSEILSDTRAAIEHPRNSDVIAIHQFRREMKRWRAYLRLLEPFLADEAEGFQDAARTLARELGGARDPQSALDALADLAKHGLPLSPRSLGMVRRRLEHLRSAGEKTLLTAELRIRIANAVSEAAAAVARWPLHMVTFPDIAKQLTAGYRAARRAAPRSWPDASAENLHELRKLVVAHRHQMQIVEPLWQRFAKMWLAEAQRLRERLGCCQDLQILAGLTGPGQPLAVWHERLAPAIALRRRQHVMAAKRIAARLFVDKPSAFRRRLNVMWETG